MARLGEQPLTRVLQDFLDLSTQFVDRDFAQVGGAFVTSSAASSSQ
jgi:hypothetical protein